MDESIVAVHMMEASDGTYVTTECIQEDEAIDESCDQMGVNDEIISANDEINDLNDIEDNNNEHLMAEEDEDLKHQMIEEEMDENLDQQNDELIDSTEADDIIIAEAVVVTQYSCKFCNRRFDTIDKVKNHYLLRHNSDKSLIERFSKNSTETDKNEEQNNVNNKESQQQNSLLKKKTKPVVTNVTKSKANQYNLRVVSNIKTEDGVLKKKRGRKPTGVQRKYPCDWPGCNYIARHSVRITIIFQSNI
jgi:hypothetical protein